MHIRVNDRGRLDRPPNYCSGERRRDTGPEVNSWDMEQECCAERRKKARCRGGLKVGRKRVERGESRGKDVGVDVTRKFRIRRERGRKKAENGTNNLFDS